MSKFCGLSPALLAMTLKQSMAQPIDFRIGLQYRPRRN
jgi:hypothetical protein